MKIRPNSKPPRSMTEARKKPDAKKRAAAHDAERNRHYTELRTWVYKNYLPSDKRVPFTMTYKAKTNKCGGVDRHKARCAIRGDIMKPRQHFDQTRTASHMPSQAARRLLLSAAVSKGPVVQSYDIPGSYMRAQNDPNIRITMTLTPLSDGTLKALAKFV